MLTPLPSARPVNVVISGGGSGMGLSTAELLRSKGHQVWITGRREAPLLQAAARIGATPVAFDASDPTAVEGAVDALPAAIDALVLNAGGLGPAVPLSANPTRGERLSAKAAEWKASFDINVMTTVLLTEALANRITIDGRIIAIGSIAGRRGAGSYGAAKAALEAWTASAARDFGPRGITVNLVSPGFIDSTEFFGGRMTKERRAQLISETFLNRPGQPEDVAHTIAFLISPQARHITGQVIPINGGAHLAR